jgi:hypothetical protein
MAFYLPTTLATGVQGEYWRLGFVDVVCDDEPFCTISMDLYLNKQAKLDGKAIMERRNTRMLLQEIDASFSFDFRACIYNSLKQSPDWIDAEDIFDDPNKNPVCRPLNVTTQMETPKVLNFSAYDPFNKSFTISIVDQPTLGSISESNGVFTYTPDSGKAGVDNFTYKATNVEGFECDPVPCTVTIPTLIPTALDASITIDMNEAVELPFSGTDPSNASLTFVVTTNPANGNVTENNGVFTYTPNNDFSGTDSLEYTASNGTYTSQAATVSIDIPNQVPTAGDLNTMTFKNLPVEVYGDGTDPFNLGLSFSVVSNPTHGNVSVNGSAFTYTPETDYVGNDSFTYSVSNGTFTSNVATISVVIEEAA